ncbi:MAG: RluA family pseudouridine synthase [Muribaculaceae bacterium]|nr:RluA family pseudouridine synthase [Muribaculaceae bacterium]
MNEKFHLLENIGTMPLPSRFTCPFCYEPHPLSLIAVGQVQRYVASRTDWLEEMDAGKMLGVLVAQDSAGQLGFLAAFSGNLAGSVHHDYFVPPVYDLLDPQGEFKLGEAQITAINHEVERLEQSPELESLKRSEAVARQEMSDEIGSFKAMMIQHKHTRDQRREAGGLSAAELDEMLDQSRFEKAELKRIRRRHEERIREICDEIAIFGQRIATMKTRRKAMSETLQERIFRLFVVSNAQGEHRDLVEVFRQLGTLPPAGAGECCAPRLLNYAFNNGLQPVCMAEFWWGASPVGEVRHHGHFYPACRSKCKPILDFMLQGLDVEDNALGVPLDNTALDEVYDDQWLTVLNKPSGMLTVPGKLLEDSLLTRYQAAHPEAVGPIVVHRLDQETSGLVIFAKDKATHHALQQQFENHTIKKTYIALLDGDVASDEGVIALPIRPDVDDRPRQRVDYEHGKPAETRYRVLERQKGKTRVEFEPFTGRTHQLRVHSSHVDGLNCPIVGDRLYGTAGPRLMLHAQRITFIHPATNRTVTLESMADF